MNHDVGNNYYSKEKNDPDIMIGNHILAFMNHVKIAHISGKMRQIPADPGENRSPDSGAGL